jgi:hypothetical protein
MYANMQRKVSKYVLQAGKCALKQPLRGKVYLEQALRAQTGSSSIDILYL